MRALLTATLTNHVIDDPKPVGAVAWRKLRELVRDASDPDTLAKQAEKRMPADAPLVLARLELLGRMERLLAELEQDGITVVSELDADYPQRLLERLGGKHPPLLFVAGSRTLLNAESIGVVGSRDVDDEGKAFARSAAEEAVSHAKAVVSGGARGVDLESMRGALDAGGTTIGFLADSLSKTARRMRELLEDGRVCLATSFSPTAGFQVGNAMARNRCIYAHSLATVVVSSAAGTGGTWTGAVEALDRKLCPVLVRTSGAVPAGNVRLREMGAIPIGSADEMWSHLREDEAPVQGVLF